MNYAVFYGGSLGNQIKKTHKGYFTQYSRFHGGCAVNIKDPLSLPLMDRVENCVVTLHREKVKWENLSTLAKRRYPKGTLIWGELGDSNPYIALIPCASFAEAVRYVKEGLETDLTYGRFCVQEWVEQESRAGRWSEFDNNKFGPLFGSEWMQSSVLPQEKDGKFILTEK